MEKQDSRYPYTYACDLIRRWAGFGNNGTKLNRADASKIRHNIADILGLNDEDVAKKLADRFLQVKDVPDDGLKDFVLSLKNKE